MEEEPKRGGYSGYRMEPLEPGQGTANSMNSHSGPSGDVGKFHRLHSGTSRSKQVAAFRYPRPESCWSRFRSSLKWSCQLAPVAHTVTWEESRKDLCGDEMSGCTINVLLFSIISERPELHHNIIPSDEYHGSGTEPNLAQRHALVKIQPLMELTITRIHARSALW
ncbi:hypothetical protein RRG08_060728 [Elysia crispata]|uniref:Uncharacterized protein n=1 Tax=Elysia crispata TaxID=231223 RepID=A0AAE0ZHP9_9GAST|nr:hypothetical protein RRG08_060728 [Elysia crispata]